MSHPHLPAAGAAPHVARFDVVKSAFPAGISLVEASAGTGKTYNIAMSVVRLLLEQDQAAQPLVGGIGHILVVTFTVAATDELVTRIREVLRLASDVYGGMRVDESNATVQQLRRLANGQEPFARARLAQAVREVDTLAVFTIHGFCKRILDEFALESGTAFGAALVDDDSALLTGALQDWWRVRFYTDAALASYAVTMEWTPETFLDDYRQWRRFPDVVVTPSPALDAARGAVDTAVAAFAAVWNEGTFREAVGQLAWNADAPCKSPVTLERLVQQARDAAVGDLGAAEAVGQACAVDALTKAATNRGKEQQARRAAIAQWPIAQAATALGEALGQFHHALRFDCLQQVRQRLDAEKRRRRALGFDDLLEQLSRVLTAQGTHGLLAQAIRQQYHAALIDEFQDTDQHQFRIFDTAFGGRPLFLIGDPKQAIYAFRGADVQAYLGAAQRATQAFTLDVNFRSSTPMVRAVNALFTHRPNAFVDAAIAFHPATARDHKAPTGYRLEGEHTLHWLFVPPDRRAGKDTFTSAGTAETLLFAACVSHIVAQIAAGCPPREIAVLVRTTQEGIRMAETLRRARVPAVVSGLGNVLQSAEMSELQLVLEAIANPRQQSRVRAALATELWGLSHAQLLELLHPEQEDAWERLLNQLDTLRALWTSRGVLPMLQQLFSDRAVADRFMALVDGDRRMTNLRHVVELLHGAASTDELNLEGVLRWMTQARQDTDREREVAELRLESDADAVQVMTMHKSKGLQFDIVYCPTLWRAYPVSDKKPVLVHEDGGVIFDAGSPDYARRRQQADVERLAEDCRLAYVALTRARFRTYVGWGPIGGKKGQEPSPWSALSFLLHREPHTNALPTEQQPAAVAAWYAANLHEWEPTLRAFCQAHGNLMALERVETTLVVPAPATVDAPTVAYLSRTLPDDIALADRLDTYRVTSFTHLTAGAHGAQGTRGGAPPGGNADVARDVDDEHESTTPAASVRDLPRTDFRSFPAGRRAGTVLHTLFETSRFDDSAERLRERVALRLLRTQLANDEGDPRIDATVQMMQTVFATPLRPWPLTLAGVTHEQTRHEWQFLLPFADATQQVSRYALAHCFEQHGGPDGARYAEQLRRLPVGRLHGFLTGFVDLVFRHGDRWYVVDWKSNQLGADPAAYTHEALQTVMETSHYTLQYHLYLVALHRYLTVRLPGYDYARHMGGAGYAYLRGFTADSVHTGQGWFTDLPSRALIESLSALMDRASPTIAPALASALARTAAAT